jgi:hypothetical protein
MANNVVELQPRGVAQYAGDAIWEKNGGIYLGMALQAFRDEADFPLEALKDRFPFRVGDNQAIKSYWERNGDFKRYTGNRQLVSIGANGSGKSRKVLMPNLFRLDQWSCAVVDTKGELCAHTAVWRARKGQKIIVVDPFGVMRQNYPRLFAKHGDILESHGVNPLAPIKAGSDSFVDDVRKIAAALATAPTEITLRRR